MNRLRCFTFLIALIGFTTLSSMSGSAAITSTGNVQPGFPWNSNTNAVVGRTSDGSLQVDGGSVLTSSNGVLGENTGVTGTVTVVGSDSRWSMGGGIFLGRSLQVGRYGTGILNIEAGGQIDLTTNNNPSQTAVYLGLAAEGTGIATVTGNNSRFTTSQVMYIGNDGKGELNIESGGYASSIHGVLGRRDGSTGTASVTGTGSQWRVVGLQIGDSGNGSLTVGSGGTVTSSLSLYVGNSGSATLDIETGGEVTSAETYLAYNTSATGAVSVVGAGAKWTNSGALYVGHLGSATLTVADGGEVVAGKFYASLDDLVGNGTITAMQEAVLDADLQFDSMNGSQSQIAFGSGGTLNVASNAGFGVGYRGSGSLIVKEGVKIVSKDGYLGFNPGSTGTASISGLGSKWTTTEDFNIGYRGTGTLTVDTRAKIASDLLNVGTFGSGTLNVLTGAQITSNGGFVGNYSTSTGVANIIGTNSRWNVNGDLFVGNQGTGTLNIEATAKVTSTNGFVRGWSPGKTGTVKVTGANSQWTVSDTLTVDQGGTLQVADGGKVVASTVRGSLSSFTGNGSLVATTGAILDADLRFDAAHPSQQLLSFGTGGTLTVNTGGVLGVGYRGHGTLEIVEGVKVNSTDGYLGLLQGSSGIATVSGIGSQWALSGSLNVAEGALTIENSGRVTSVVGNINNGSGADSDPIPGMVMVMGAGSQWINFGELTVGYNGLGTLIISDGGYVANTDGYLGREEYYGVGKAVVTGANSRWVNEGSLTIGRYGSGELTIEDGAQVSSATGHIYGFFGAAALEGSGHVKVTGLNSKWTMSGDLDMDSTRSAMLTIEDGAEVKNANARIFEGGHIKVTGNGSRWINSGRLEVGIFGMNSLTIENGARVESAGGFLDTQDDSTTVATITGPGSRWKLTNAGWPNTGFLYMGSGGTMNLRDGAKVMTASDMEVRGFATIDVGSNSLVSINNGNGQLQNDGVIRILAGPGALPGSQHTPIAASTWEGTGTYEAVGGTWDDVNHVFTVSEAIEGIAGAPLSVDLDQYQQAIIEGNARGRNLGISLLAQAGVATINASVLSDALLGSLANPQRQVVNGWNLAVSGDGYSVGDPLFLSLVVPSALERSGVSLWRYDGRKWQSFIASDLTVSGGYASFTAGNGGTFALTIFVPEPGTQLMTCILLLALFGTRLRFVAPRSGW